MSPRIAAYGGPALILGFMVRLSPAVAFVVAPSPFNGRSRIACEHRRQPTREDAPGLVGAPSAAGADGFSASVVALLAAAGIAALRRGISTTGHARSRPLLAGRHLGPTPAWHLRRRAGPAAEVEPQAPPAKTASSWWDDTVEFWREAEVWDAAPIEEDEAPEAKAVVAQLDKIEALRKELDEKTKTRAYLRERADAAVGGELNKVPVLVFEYWKMRISRVLEKRTVRKGLTGGFSLAYFAFILIFFRTFVPRLLAIQSMDDVFGVANEIGMPSRANLLAALQTLNEYDPFLKIGLYQLAFVLEKVTLVSEILPIQIGLKTIAPLIFGGLLPGALISATCETVGATVTFFLGRGLLTERLREFQFFGGDPLGEAPWFDKVQRAADGDGLRLTLLLRLAHVLPLPFDLYWYILGALPVGVLEFVAAHWVGCLKTAFLDASLGELLLTSATLESGQQQGLVAAEAGGFVVVALLVSTFATKLANELLGLDEDDAASPDAPTEKVPPSGQHEQTANNVASSSSGVANDLPGPEKDDNALLDAPAGKSLTLEELEQTAKDGAGSSSSGVARRS
mmetsp:Transcript_110959/g.312835  ORF Transcript_110959/g.312835 Transcript_110959/m.312835 type:complete len:569 (-) Transcript_110959:45-1751(-)